jgi:hypothetical protein
MKRSNERIVKHSNGDVYHYNSKNELHCETGPAIIYTNNDKSWYFKDKIHRLDGPAVCWTAYQQWWINDKFYYKAEHSRLVLFSVLEPYKINTSPM